MLGLYTPLLILQAVCLYHAYRNNAEQRWYWFIIIFPGVGCALYIFHHMYNRNNIQNLKQGLQQAVNSNYRIEQLEKQVRFVDNIANKTNLADAYMTVGRYADALSIYQDCLQGVFMADDPSLRMKALQAAFLSGNHALAVTYGQALETEKSFKNAGARIDYAWALHRSGQTPAAEAAFKDLNKSFTNYPHRVAYCRFLMETNDIETLRAILRELLDEFDHMKGPERRYHRAVISEVKEMARKPAPAAR